MQLNTPLYTLGPYDAPLWQGNARDDSGCDWICTSETGWSSTPPVRPSQLDKTTGDGTWAGTGYYAGRLVTLEGTCVAPDQVSMLWAKETVKSAAGPRDLVQLRVDELHLSRTALVRLATDIEVQDKGNVAFTWQMGLFAPDPRRYSANVVSQSCVLPGAANQAGRTYPRAYPLGYGYATGTGNTQVVVMQAGNYQMTPALITVHGPVINPVVAHDRSGSAIALLMTVGFGQYVTIDLGAEAALLNGTTPVNALMSASSAWFLLAAGDNVLAFRGSAGTGADGSPGTPTMTVTAASAWA